MEHDASTAEKIAQGLIGASPLTLLLLVLLVLAAAALLASYKLIPHLVTKREKARRQYDVIKTEEFAKYTRVEDIAKRLHSFQGDVAVANLLAMKIKDLEVDMDKQRQDSGDLRKQIADLAGGQRELHAKVDGVSSSVDRVEEMVGTITSTLLGFIPRGK